jgi:hypothetical protein
MALKPRFPATLAKQPEPRTTLLRPLATLLVLGTGWGILAHPGLRPSSAETNLPKAVLSQLTRQGLFGRIEELRWIDPPEPGRHLAIAGQRFVAILHRENEDTDVWLGRAQLTPEGRLLDVSSLHNLTDTSAVGERALTVNTQRVAWTVEDEGLTLSVHLAGLGGISLAEQKDWSAFDRIKTRITFLQETGQLEGISEQVFRLDPPRRSLGLAWLDDKLLVTDGQAQTSIDSQGRLQGNLELKQEPTPLGQPGDWITWSVDRVRALPWFGSDRMQWLKTVAFTLLDYSSRVKSSVVDRDGSGELRTLLGDTVTLSAHQAPDPETGWPPAPIEPRLKPALPGEGEYSTLDNDPFAVPEEGGHSPFAFTFLRTDSVRPHSQVFLVAWDPRRIELHTMTGTREPKTATGETGPGRVPRTRERMGRLAAAFNGGFQATHGEFGMMADRVVYLPPKPYAATIAEMDDGTTGLGTWPEDDAIGSEFVGYRQNLTPLLSDGKDNPYGRTWWGGVPPGWQDATRTVRTGLCLTKDGNLVYFYGSSIDSENLTVAMNSARCNYGVHLDMNPGHTGLEFYRVGQHGSLPPLGRKLDSSWEASGSVSDMSGWNFLGRRMIRSMHLMNFPRYARTDTRDFFYLTHRQILTPERLKHPSATMQPKGIEWQVSGLPHQGFPPAIAMAKLSPDPTRPSLAVSVVVLDGKWAKPSQRSGGDGKAILTSKAPSKPSELRAVYSQRAFRIESSESTTHDVTKPPSDAATLVVATGHTKANASIVRAAVGTTDGQWLYYVEITKGADPAHDVNVLARLLDDFGCQSRLFLERPLAITIGERPDDDTAAVDRITWVRDDAPMARRILEQTPIVPLTVWHPLQEKRIRYKRQRPVNNSPSATELPSEVPQNGAASPVDTDTEAATPPTDTQ